MDRQTFVSVFAGVGSALGLMLLALGVVAVVAADSKWGMVLAGVLVLFGTGMAAALLMPRSDVASGRTAP